MNLDELRAVQDREREKDSLQHLRDSFYEEIGTYVADLQAERERRADQTEDPFADPEVRRLTDEIETAEEVAESIYERRMGKVVKTASLAAAGYTADTDGLTEEEAALFDDLVERIEANQETVLDVLSGMRGGSAATERDGDAADEEHRGGAAADDGVGAPGADENAAPAGSDSVGELESSGADAPDALESADEEARADAEPGDVPSTAPDAGAEPPEPSASTGADATGGTAADPSAAADSSTAADSSAAADSPAAAAAGGDAPPADESEGTGDAAPLPGEDGRPDAEADAAASERAGGFDAAAAMGDPDRVTVRITDDVGEIVGVDGTAYDLAPDDVVTLPEANAMPLLEKEAATRVE